MLSICVYTCNVKHPAIFAGHDLRSVSVHKAPLILKVPHWGHAAGEILDFGILAGYDLLACVVYKAVPGPAGLAALNSKTAVAGVAGLFVLVDCCGYIARFVDNAPRVTILGLYQGVAVAEVPSVVILAGDNQDAVFIEKSIFPHTIGLRLYPCHAVGKFIH